MRDRLIEIIKKVPYGISVGAKFQQHFCEKVADQLLENGVIAPPAKIGDTAYYITGIHNTLIKSAKIEEIYYRETGFAYQLYGNYTYFTVQQDQIYFTKEEAQRALEAELSRYTENCKRMVEQAKTEVAREFFEDIKNALAQMGIVFYSQPILYELEKKYTEGNDGKAN